MNLNPSQKSLCERVVNTWETGAPNGRYGSLVIYSDGPHKMRQITYGRSQTTEFGNLGQLVQDYVDANGLYSDALRPYAGRVGHDILTDNDEFKSLLRQAGKDPVMQATQDAFFDACYFQPAMAWAGREGFTEALSALVIYDSWVHSGGILNFLRARFPELTPANGGQERGWIAAYTQTRNDWLRNNSSTLLQKTAYRTDDLLREIARGNWDLAQLPFMANGTAVNP